MVILLPSAESFKKGLLPVTSKSMSSKYWLTASCADPGIFVRGDPGQSDKKSSDVFFFSLHLITEVKWLISKKTIIFQGSRGCPTFSRGSNFFQGGSNCLFPIETHINCDFPGGVQTPCPPLNPHLCLFKLAHETVWLGELTVPP